MREKIFIGAIILLLILPLAAAYQTKIDIKTNPGQLISINVYDSRNDDKLFNTFERVDDTGSLVKSVSTGTKEIDVIIVSKDNNNVILGEQELLSHTAGSDILVDFSTTPEANETESDSTITGDVVDGENTEDEETTEEEPEIIGDTPSITGAAVEKIKGFFSKTVAYVVGIIVLAAIIGFLVMLGIKKKRRGGSIVTKKLSDLQKERRESEKDREIERAEEKLKEAQQEINRIKNESKIKEAERKMEEDRERLEKLRRGED